MSKPARILRDIAIAAAALAAATAVCALWLIHTEWFRNYAREKIVAAIQDGTGGRTEIGSFNFDASQLHAHITNLVIHGSEPAGAAPFVSVASVDLEARAFTNGHFIGISNLAIDRPQVNVLVFADGRTNVPAPKPSAPSRTTPLETVVDLAVGRFDLRQGMVSINDQKQPLDVQARNLHAQLSYHLLQHNYQGTLSLEPIYVVSGRNTPLTIRATLPVVLERDNIRLHDAHIATQNSDIQIDGSMKNFRQPEVSARIRGRLAIAELKDAADLPLDTSPRDTPKTINLEADAAGSYDRIRVSSLKLAVGQSTVTASGVLRDPQGQGSLQFNGELALAELARLARTGARAAGTLKLGGDAKLDAANRYQVAGHLASRNLAVDQGTLHIRHADVSTDATVTPDRIDLKDLHLAALGGEFSGDASLENYRAFRLKGTLRHLDIQQALNLAGERLPYSGFVSGAIESNGDTKATGTRGLEARTELSIAPGRQGIPVQGRLQASYNGARDDISVNDSYVTLPHSRLTLAGSTQRQLDVSLTTHDLRDFTAAAPASGPPPVTLNGGQAAFTGAVHGALRAPHITGHLTVNRFQMQGRAFNSLDADLAASSSGVAMNHGSLTRGTMQASFSATVGLRAWSPAAAEPVSADVAVQNGDLADIMVMAGQPNQDYTGTLNATLHAGGTIGNPTGSAAVHVANGTLQRESFDRLDAQVKLADQLATIPSATIASGNARADLTAEFRHPRDSFTTGSIRAKLQTNSIDLAHLRDLQKQTPDTSGQAQVNADVTGTLSSSDFQMTGLDADASVRALHFEGQSYGDLQMQAHTSGQTAALHVTSNFAGSVIRVDGTTQLVQGYPTSASASVSGLPIERALTIAQRSDIPARGKLSATAHMRGPLLKPEGDASLDLSNAVVYDEVIDRMHARLSYAAQRIDVSQFELASGPSRIDMSATFDHPAGNLESGDLQIHVKNGSLDLGKLRNVQKLRPGLSGTLQLAADSSAALHATSPRVLLTGLNASISGSNLASDGKSIGGLDLSARTTSGNHLDFTLKSDIAGSSIQASGNGELGADYPVSAQLSFSNVRWARLAPLLGPANEPPSFDAMADGKVSVNGPAMQIDRLQGSLQLTRLAVQTLPQPGTGQSITIQNQGPVVATLDHGAVKLDSFHFAGPKTDIQASGSIAVPARTVSLNTRAAVDLKVLESFDRDITSSGAVNLSAAVRGTVSSPETDGKLELHNASFNYATIPNGLSNANGVVQFRGAGASIQNLTAESGGGKVTLSGFVAFGSDLRFALRANASSVRVRVEPGASVVAAADLRLGGTIASSTATGTVTLEQLNYVPKSDLGALLARAAPAVQNTSAPSPLLDNMKLDVHVRTSPAMHVRTSLGENLQTDADLHLQGSASQPAVLGRINLTEGRLAFFGSTYTINKGSISFYNPARIDPILNLSLETQAKGVDVVLNVTGPVDNMKLTYTSDPPLQFQEIVGLLATGTAPTSDPTLLANQPSVPPQTVTQRGESAILGEAVASPTAEQLQRVFGVSQLKIDPTFTGSSQLPTAQVTLQQQVTPNITFTYVSALDAPNSTLIRAEWAMNQQWSAMAVRDQNGVFSINLLYKKEFR